MFICNIYEHKMNLSIVLAKTEEIEINFVFVLPITVSQLTEKVK
jgi:hypothetical protein